MAISIVDASGGRLRPTRCAAISPASARCRCCSSAADFDKLDGKLQAKIAVRSTGASQRAIMSNLDGTVFAMFQDGAIRGLNVAQMIRSLTSSTLSGWQESKEQTTDLTPACPPRSGSKRARPPPAISIWSGPLVRMTGAGTIDLGQPSRWRSGSSPSWS